MKLYVRAHDLSIDDPLGLCAQADKLGFAGFQLVLYKTFNRLKDVTKPIDMDFVNSVKQSLDKYGLQTVMLGAYFNPLHSDTQYVSDRVVYFKRMVDLCSLFGCKLVGSETGSYNDDKWTYNPLNRTDEALNSIARYFWDLPIRPNATTLTLQIRGRVWSLRIQSYRSRVVHRIDNGHVRIIVDLFNYLDVSNCDKQREIFDECLELFGDKISIFHLKDYVHKDGKLVQVGLGQGELDLKYILPIIKAKYPKASLVFEGVKSEDMTSSVKYAKHCLRKKKSPNHYKDRLKDN